MRILRFEYRRRGRGQKEANFTVRIVLSVLHHQDYPYSMNSNNSGSRTNRNSHCVNTVRTIRQCAKRSRSSEI